MHPTQLFMLQAQNEMTAMSLGNRDVKVNMVTTYEYQYDAQGYPVSAVEKDAGDVSAKVTYEYE